MFCNHYQPEAGSRQWNDFEGYAHLGDCLKCHLLAAVSERLHVRPSFHRARQHFWTNQPGQFSCMIVTQWQASHTFRFKLFFLEAVMTSCMRFLTQPWKRSLCSDQAVGWTPHESWFDSWRGQETSFFSNASRPTLGLSQPPVQGDSLSESEAVGA